MKTIEEMIKYDFNDKSILKNALSHSSYANESKRKIANNERLEFLGDSILSICVSDYIFSNFTDLPEGDLSRIRAAVVCEKSLFNMANRLNIGEHIYLGKGEIATGGRNRPSILADCVEALIAGIYLDSNLENAKKFILDNLINDINLNKEQDISDYKTKLQEIVQQNPEEIVQYKIVSEEGPDHDKIFTVEVNINSNSVATGKGKSKKIAEQMAAKKLLRLMGE